MKIVSLINFILVSFTTSVVLVGSLPIPNELQDRDLEDTGDALQKVGSIIEGITPVADALGPEGEALGVAVDVVASFLDILGQFLGAIGEDQREDAAARGAFTQSVTEGTLKKHPGWNVITHDINFQGIEGPDWSHDTTSLDTHAGNIGFDVYAARAGVFQLNGDGGFLNWAFSGPNIQQFGEQGHRLVLSGTPPTNIPTSGSCGVHVTQFQKNEKDANPFPFYTLSIILKDGAGVVIGFNGNGNGDAPVDVGSQLSSVFTVTAGAVDDDPLGFQFIDDKWDSSKDAGRCSVGKYDSGKREMDCGFACTF